MAGCEGDDPPVKAAGVGGEPSTLQRQFFSFAGERSSQRLAGRKALGSTPCWSEDGFRVGRAMRGEGKSKQ